MKIEINDDYLDVIMCQLLKDSISLVQKEIERLQNKKKLSKVEKIDLYDCYKNLEALDRVHNYYGGNLK